MPGVTVDLKDLKDFERDLAGITEEVLASLDGETGAQIREVMSTTAKNLAPSNRYKGGGTLRQMIDTSEQGFSKRTREGVQVGITSHADYSIYVEWGTGYKGDPRVDHTSKKHWVYFDEGDQKFYPGLPHEARHFMEPALDDNIDNICEIIAGNIQEVFEQ